MNHNKYEKNTDSKIKWIGKIPSHWSTSKFKHEFIFSKSINTSNNPTILSLTLKGIKIRDISTNEGQIASSYDNYTKVHKKDIVLNPMDLISGFVDCSPVEGVISPAYYTLKPNKDVDPEYYKYYIQKHYYERIFFPFAEGVSVDHRWTLKKEDFLNFSIIKPPYKEQKQIADYLDKQTAKIDMIISKNEMLIHLLEEKRTALINNILTKGLIPSVPMKDSGFDWIGKIPEHWEFISIGNFSSLITDYVANGSFASLRKNVEYLDEESYAILVRLVDNTNNFKGPFVYINEDSYNFLSKTKLKEGDIILANIGATLGTVFRVPNLGKPMSLGPNVLLVRFKNNINGEYFLNLINSDIGKCFIDSITTQTTQPKFNKTELRKLKILHPPINEQEQINKKINEINKNINAPIIKIKKQIELLDEYKISLIHHVVTGKLDIRSEK